MKLAVSLRCRSRFQKRDLSAIGVACPFVQGENAGEFVLIANAAHASFGQVVVHHSFVMRDNVPGTEAQSGDRHHLLTPEFEAQLRGMFDQPGMHFNNGWRGNRQADQRSKTSAEPIVCQYSRVLWVVLELDYIEVAVRAAHEMALGAAAHSADVLDRLNCHEIFRFCRGLKELRGRRRGSSGAIAESSRMTIPESQEVRCFLYSGIVKGKNSAASLVAEHAAGRGDASFDAFRFVLDDGGGWTLNGPLPRSNGWNGISSLPDTRPLSASDIAAANRRHDEALSQSPWFRLWQSYGVCCRPADPGLSLPESGS